REEGGLGGQILRSLALAAEPMALELGEDFVERRAGDVHLIERLHGREPRGAAPVGLALVVGRRAGVFPRTRAGPGVRWSRPMASAARAASPPLPPPSGRARAHACTSV